jgi:hypothetical protein
MLSATRSRAWLESSVRTIEATARADASGFEVAWRLARTYSWLVEQAQDREQKEKLGKIGMAWAESAQALEQDRIDRPFFLTIAIGTQADAIGQARAVREGLKGKLDKAPGLKRVPRASSRSRSPILSMESEPAHGIGHAHLFAGGPRPARARRGDCGEF